jgi:hypothetical protein
MIVPKLPAIAPTEPPSLNVLIYGVPTAVALPGIHFTRRDLAQVRVRDGVIERRLVQGIPSSTPHAPNVALSVHNEDSLGWIDVGVVQVRRHTVVITAGDIFGPPKITQQFERVHEAEQNREFRELLDASSIGKPPKGFEREPSIGAGMCQPCREDRCSDIECAVPTGCACSCTADKEALATEMITLFNDLDLRFNDDDMVEVASFLYGKGWRREA